ncbi:hypothetical protein J5N97_012796 [Dioscorea zingiberensis]|uniref:BUD13 homolog n=1 Tax=Dioscorea zingiberensis TaxID=325984 RepID=A0A9D5CRQ8_9LILI|nr:hypothetical protein J5N97_012796 [Dioscorea zingiberensis]
MAATAPTSISLKDYLKRYESGAGDPKATKKKKKKASKPSSTNPGVIVVDEDPVWQKPVKLEESEPDSPSEEEPQIDEDIEVKRAKRLEAIRARKPYHGISEDGSGWVPVTELSRASDSRHNGPDLSPPRQRRARFDMQSPERDVKPSVDARDEDGDLSPPRRRTRHYSPDGAKPRGSPSDDLSPPRQVRRRSEDPESDLSPPRRRKSQDADLSPPRRSRKGPESGLSPSRSHRNSQSGDLSPPRRNQKDQGAAKEARPPKAGLFSGNEITGELNKKKKEELMRFATMDPSVSGRGAEPAFRDKEGNRISKEEKLKSKEQEEKPKEKKLEWGKGLAQKRGIEALARELELEKNKPFARTRDDPELDTMLKERVRWGDPMAHLVKRKHSEPVLEDFGENEKMMESGFVVPQTIPPHSWLKRGLDFPPNRYGIRPGRHWDGVDRSTGYEKEFFMRQNEKRATESEAYLWSVADM